jgi:hypothetical protein
LIDLLALSADKLLLNFEKKLKSFSDNKLHESPEGSFENKDSKFDSIFEIRDSKSKSLSADNARRSIKNNSENHEMNKFDGTLKIEYSK